MSALIKTYAKHLPSLSQIQDYWERASEIDDRITEQFYQAFAVVGWISTAKGVFEYCSDLSAKDIKAPLIDAGVRVFQIGYILASKILNQHQWLRRSAPAEVLKTGERGEILTPEIRYNVNATAVEIEQGLSKAPLKNRANVLYVRGVEWNLSEDNSDLQMLGRLLKDFNVDYYQIKTKKRFYEIIKNASKSLKNYKYFFIHIHGFSGNLSFLSGNKFDITDGLPDVRGLLAHDAKIFLYSCSTGKICNGIAQHLANLTQRRVFAPTFVTYGMATHKDDIEKVYFKDCDNSEFHSPALFTPGEQVKKRSGYIANTYVQTALKVGRYLCLVSMASSFCPSLMKSSFNYINYVYIADGLGEIIESTANSIAPYAADLSSKLHVSKAVGQTISKTVAVVRDALSFPKKVINLANELIAPRVSEIASKAIEYSKYQAACFIYFCLERL